MRILYVEDDLRDVDLLKRELAAQMPEINVDAVSSLSQARAALAAAQHYDLALIDLQLPDGSGLDLLAEIRYKALPLAVVILTGRGDEQTAVAALKTGANDYLVKRQGYLSRLPLVLETALECFKAEVSRMEQPLKVLYAEHNPVDIELTRRHMIRYAPYIHLEAVPTATAVLERLTKDAESSGGTIDALLLDYRLPGTNALELFETGAPGLQPGFAGCPDYRPG